MTDKNRNNVELTLDLFKQWILLADHGKKGDPIRPKISFEGPANRNYQLKNGRIKKFLQWEEQIGMNIGWTENAEPETAKRVQRWFFTRDGENEAPIRYGETIAIGNGKSPSFLQYEERKVGVNIQWRDNPAFQWRLLGGTPGTPVTINKWLAIYNEKIEECFIFVDRTIGGDVGWPSSKTWGAQAIDELKGLGEDALKKLAAEAIKALLTG